MPTSVETEYTGMTRRDFLKEAAALAVGAALGGCSGAQLKQGQSKKARPSFVPAEIELIPFQDYSPEPATEQLRLEDGMLEAYITRPYRVSQMKYRLPYVDSIGEVAIYSISRIDIKDPERFKTEVIAIAKELGLSLDELKGLSIHDALMLSGRIVGHKMEYDHEMITNEEKAAKIDSLADDEVFFGGFGVCRNYAGAECAVFEVLKGLNPNLRNTYMRWYSPWDDHAAFRHAWDLASTIARGPRGMRVLMTYVDPTFLDTKNRTVDNTGKKLEHVSDEELYNALDERHFYKGALVAHRQVAELYEALGNTARERFPLFKTSREAIGAYMRKALEIRMDVCDMVMDIIEADPKSKYLYAPHFQKSFDMGVILVEDYPDYTEAYLPDMERELLKVYGRAKKAIPGHVDDQFRTARKLCAGN